MFRNHRIIYSSVNKKVILNTLKQYSDIYDKGRSEENVYMQKQQAEDIKRLKKLLKKDERVLERKIKESEEKLKKMDKEIKTTKKKG